MKIINGNVLHAADNNFKKQNITIENGRITALDESIDDNVTFDVEGLFVISGFIDTHIHGCVGVEFASPSEDFSPAQKWLASQGITGFAATVRSLPLERIIAAEHNIVSESRKQPCGAKVLGINLEGPFISFSKSGVMNPPQIECNRESVRLLSKESNGLLKLMTIAPERENSYEVIKEAVDNGINPSIGHTDSDYKTAIGAIDAGACRATHIFNAMRPFCHRETGVLGAVLTDDRVNCEMICDLVHLDEATIKLVYRAKGYKNITLISDTGFMSGLPDGEYLVDGRVRTVENGVCRNKEGRIAGSCVSMLAGARNLLSLGVPMEEISVMASLNPAKALGVDRETGSIEIGKYADLIVCDKELNIKAVFVNGKKV